MTDEVKRAIDMLLETARLLMEVDRIGLWSSSDDSSDNRKKRDGLREADWAISDACRQLAAVPAPPGDPQLFDDVRALASDIEPLASLVTDWMGTNNDLDYRVSDTRGRAEELAGRLGEAMRD